MRCGEQSSVTDNAEPQLSAVGSPISVNSAPISKLMVAPMWGTLLILTNKKLHIWDVDTLQSLHTIRRTEKIISFIPDEDSNFLFVGTATTLLQLTVRTRGGNGRWESASDPHAMPMEHPVWALAVAHAREGGTLFLANSVGWFALPVVTLRPFRCIVEFEREESESAPGDSLKDPVAASAVLSVAGPGLSLLTTEVELDEGEGGATGATVGEPGIGVDQGDESSEMEWSSDGLAGEEAVADGLAAVHLLPQDDEEEHAAQRESPGADVVSPSSSRFRRRRPLSRRRQVASSPNPTAHHRWMVRHSTEVLLSQGTSTWFRDPLASSVSLREPRMAQQAVVVHRSVVSCPLPALAATLDEDPAQSALTEADPPPSNFPGEPFPDRPRSTLPPPRPSEPSDRLPLSPPTAPLAAHLPRPSANQGPIRRLFPCATYPFVTVAARRLLQLVDGRTGALLQDIPLDGTFKEIAACPDETALRTGLLLATPPRSGQTALESDFSLQRASTWLAQAALLRTGRGNHEDAGHTGQAARSNSNSSSQAAYAGSSFRLTGGTAGTTDLDELEAVSTLQWINAVRSRPESFLILTDNGISLCRVHPLGMMLASLVTRDPPLFAEARVLLDHLQWKQRRERRVLNAWDRWAMRVHPPSVSPALPSHPGVHPMYAWEPLWEAMHAASPRRQVRRERRLCGFSRFEQEKYERGLWHLWCARTRVSQVLALVPPLLPQGVSLRRTGLVHVPLIFDEVTPAVALPMLRYLLAWRRRFPVEISAAATPQGSPRIPRRERTASPRITPGREGSGDGHDDADDADGDDLPDTPPATGASSPQAISRWRAEIAALAPGSSVRRPQQEDVGSDWSTGGVPQEAGYGCMAILRNRLLLRAVAVTAAVRSSPMASIFAAQLDKPGRVDPWDSWVDTAHTLFPSDCRRSAPQSLHALVDTVVVAAYLCLDQRELQTPLPAEASSRDSDGMSSHSMDDDSGRRPSADVNAFQDITEDDSVRTHLALGALREAAQPSTGSGAWTEEEWHEDFAAEESTLGLQLWGENRGMEASELAAPSSPAADGPGADSGWQSRLMVHTGGRRSSFIPGARGPRTPARNASPGPAWATSARPRSNGPDPPAPLEASGAEHDARGLRIALEAEPTGDKAHRVEGAKARITEFPVDGSESVQGAQWTRHQEDLNEEWGVWDSSERVRNESSASHPHPPCHPWVFGASSWPDAEREAVLLRRLPSRRRRYLLQVREGLRSFLAAKQVADPDEVHLRLLFADSHPSGLAHKFRERILFDLSRGAWEVVSARLISALDATLSCRGQCGALLSQWAHSSSTEVHHSDVSFVRAVRWAAAVHCVRLLRLLFRLLARVGGSRPLWLFRTIEPFLATPTHGPWRKTMRNAVWAALCGKEAVVEALLRVPGEHPVEVQPCATQTRQRLDVDHEDWEPGLDLGVTVRVPRAEPLSPEQIAGFLVPSGHSLETADARRVALLRAVFENALQERVQLTRRSEEMLARMYLMTLPQGSPAFRHRLQLLLFVSRDLHPLSLWRSLPPGSWWAERVGLLRHLGCHEKALSIIVHQLGDERLAEAYCEAVVADGDPHSRSVFALLLQVHLRPSTLEPSSLLEQPSRADETEWDGASASRPAAAMRSPSAVSATSLRMMSLLERHTSRLDGASVLQALPDDTPVASLGSFVRRVMRQRLRDVRRESLRRATWKQFHDITYERNRRVREAEQAAMDAGDVARARRESSRRQPSIPSRRKRGK